MPGIAGVIRLYRAQRYHCPRHADSTFQASGERPAFRRVREEVGVDHRNLRRRSRPEEERQPERLSTATPSLTRRLLEQMLMVSDLIHLPAGSSNQSPIAEVAMQILILGEEQPGAREPRQR